MLKPIVFVLICAGALAFAQKGDRPGEVQKQPAFPIPPSPVLSPEQALQSFKLAPGFRIELVASEPLIHDPVAVAFDPAGRIWVVEMRGFMPDMDGKGEDAPVGRVVVLDDTNGDGRMDTSRVFIDGLVMPRAIALVDGGALVAEPPHLWFCRDTDGDGRADEKIEVASDYGNRANPEHTANSLMRAMDNWIYSANHTVRFRNTSGDWQRGQTAFRGQWGLSQDNFGRLFFNSNSDQLRCDLVPAEYLMRNPNYRERDGMNVRVVNDQSVWPIRVNPGVNRGYRDKQLRDDGTLATFTAACGPVIYRGDNFPREFHGNAFVCEPSGNLVKRDILTESNCFITGRSAYAKSEFLASTDERFRPVNACTAPDGTLYIVDLYRGILQHRIYVTSYLREQILSRGLDQPVGLGRIYRIVHEGKPPGPRPQLSKATPAELVGLLSHPNGWWRDTAQQLLVERADLSAVPALIGVTTNSSNSLTRLHALWTLDGLRQLDLATLDTALKDEHPKVRAAAIRLHEPYFDSEEKYEVVNRLLALTSDTAPDVQLQLAFTLSEAAMPAADDGLMFVLDQSAGHSLVRAAVLSGLNTREPAFLETLLARPAWQTKATGRTEMLSGLAERIMNGRQPAQVDLLLATAARQNGSIAWRKQALLNGLAATLPAVTKGMPAPKIKPVRFSEPPAGWLALNKSANAATRAQIEKIGPLLAWPGKTNYEPEPVATPLTAGQQKLFDLGKTLYEVTCAQCHRPDGMGQDGLAPPLADSDWTTGSEQRLVRIILQGVRGPITVKGKVYELDMPGLVVFDDEQVAAVATYVRRSWGHTASPVEPETVKKIRETTEGREEAWSEEELLEIP